jgi:hypothetical protein
VASHGRALSLSGGAVGDGAAAVALPSSGGVSQKWRLEPAPTAGYFYVRCSARPQVVLDWGVQKVGGKVHLWSVHGSGNQQWRAVPSGQADHSVHLQSLNNMELVLDCSGEALVMNERSGAASSA